VRREIVIDVARLRVFREVIREGSFTAAAQRLQLTQPAVSHHITHLERELGVQLIERSSRGVRLTGPGETLFRRSEHVLNELVDVEREVTAIARVQTGRLRVGVFPTAAGTLIPPVVAAFQSQFPGVALEISEVEPYTSLVALRDGVHDVVLEYSYPVPAVDPDPVLRREPFLHDDLVAVLPDGHRLAGREAADLGELLRDPWVAPRPCSCRDALEHAWREAGGTPRVVATTNDYMAMQGLVAAEVGVAVMPRLAAAIAVRHGVVLRPLTGRHLVRTTSFVTRAHEQQLPAVRTFCRLVREHATAAQHPRLPLRPVLPPRVAGLDLHPDRASAA
jgi:DNA-binding transcriptional LysR family regulator